METFSLECQISSIQGRGRRKLLFNSCFLCFPICFCRDIITIAFGGFAERAKFSAYVVFAVLFSALVYPVIAHWIWGGGWLAEHGKQDFAGSTVVHLTGAMAALAATILLKPRIGKYNKDGTANNLADIIRFILL